MSKNRRTKSTGNGAELLKGPPVKVYLKAASSYRAWEKDGTAAKPLNININNNFAGNSININIVHRETDLPSAKTEHPGPTIQGLDQMLRQTPKPAATFAQDTTRAAEKLLSRPQSNDGRKTPAGRLSAEARLGKKDPVPAPSKSSGRNTGTHTVTKSHGMFSPKGNTKVKLEVRELDKVPSAAALLSPKYMKKPIIPVAKSPPEPKLIDANLIDPVKCVAFKSRPGCLPNKVQKTNQDSYVVAKNFANVRNFWMCGVFDGHGVNGHFVSGHVKQYLPGIHATMSPSQRTSSWQITQVRGRTAYSQLLIVVFKHKCVDKPQVGLLSADMKVRHEIIKDGFLKTNTAIRNQSFDVNFSGSTAVTVLFMGDKLICSNVGDSRAILASYKSPKDIKNVQLPPEFAKLPDTEKIWLALPLSRDHKPDDEEEYKRIMDANGRVEPFKEPTGEAVGPHRVWLKDENVPGLAMSRSLGDKVASQVGVISEPEIYETTISPDDKFVIIASDGIWEFLPNDQVVEMVAPFWEENNPEGACDKLINEAVHHWQNEDEVIDDITDNITDNIADDITVIVLFLSVPARPQKTCISSHRITCSVPSLSQRWIRM